VIIVVAFLRAKTQKDEEVALNGNEEEKTTRCVPNVIPRRAVLHAVTVKSGSESLQKEPGAII
jgi:hypothetical protein